ncbi:MAG: hypothetical protein ABEK10_02035 [Candidatus Nanosalina sp.]
MAHHYAGVDPDAAAQNTEKLDEFDSVSIPGSREQYDVKAVFELDEIMHEGELIPASKVHESKKLGEFIEDFSGNKETLGAFLAYGENEWDAEDFWLQTDYRRDAAYQVTTELEVEHGLVEMEHGNVSLTSRGREVYSAFETLSEDERILSK